MLERVLQEVDLLEKQLQAAKDKGSSIEAAQELVQEMQASKALMARELAAAQSESAVLKEWLAAVMALAQNKSQPVCSLLAQACCLTGHYNLVLFLGKAEGDADACAM